MMLVDEKFVEHKNYTNFLLMLLNKIKSNWITLGKFAQLKMYLTFFGFFPEPKSAFPFVSTLVDRF